jgi:outer membrane biosynthesis protein TonB
MTPQSPARKRRNSSKVNLLIAFAFHAVIVLALVYFAAREGLLGKELKKIAVEMVKEKAPEKPKEPDKPREEAPKPEPARVAETPKLEPRKEMATTPTPAPSSTVTAPPPVAPPADELPSFEFEGGKAVQTSSDPALLYKGFVEYALRANWTRPGNVVDDDYVAEVEVSVDRGGQISDPLWKKHSGDGRWDDSVRAAIAATKRLNRAPPANFPARVVVRFDVRDATEPVVQ